MVTYEVWNDENNSSLLNEVSDYLEQPAGGVPYIIIGDKVFAGYASDYDESIKEAIVDLYNTKKKDRYDVLEEMEKHPKKTATSGSTSTSSIWVVIVCNFVFTVVAVIAIMSHMNNQTDLINEQLSKLVIKETEHTQVVKKNNSKKSN